MNNETKVAWYISDLLARVPFHVLIQNEETIDQAANRLVANLILPSEFLEPMKDYLAQRTEFYYGDYD